MSRVTLAVGTRALLVLLAVGMAALAGVAVGVFAAASRSARRLASAAERLGYSLGYFPNVGSSDHLTSLRRRVPAVLVAWTEVGDFHTTRDTVETVETWRLRQAGEVTVQAILELAATA